MARYYGKVGYAIPTKTAPGVITEKIVERAYKGSIVNNSRRLESGTGINDNIRVSNDLDILADAFAYQNFHSIRYATYMGSRWKVDAVEVRRPRLILSLGGVYNGEIPGEDPESDGRDSGPSSR